METIHYILDNWDYLLTLTLQHLWLVALAVGLAILIGVPLGLLCALYLARFCPKRLYSVLKPAVDLLAGGRYPGVSEGWHQRTLFLT